MMSSRLPHYLCQCACFSLLMTMAAPPYAAVKKKVSTVEKNVEQIHFNDWKDVSDFTQEMVKKNGFDEAILKNLFEQARYTDAAIQLVKPAPADKPKNWKAYRARFVEPVRIDAGIAFWDKYEQALNRAEQQYGVPAEIIVGIIGVESIFGKTTGKFRVLDVLTTLAFAYPDTPNRQARMDFFRSELEQFLLLTRDTQSSALDWKGSYAGAIGWPQFMPGSLRKYGVDFDGDGKIDITGSPIDAIGSIAHFLAENGWQKSGPLVYPATLLTTADDPEFKNLLTSQKLQASFHLSDLKRYLSTAVDTIPENDVFGVVDLQNGQDATEYWLAGNNFYAITHYNRSYFYAMSVIDLGKVIHAARLSSIPINK